MSRRTKKTEICEKLFIKSNKKENDMTYHWKLRFEKKWVVFI